MQITPGNLASVFVGFNTRFQGARRAAAPVTERLAMSMPSTGERNVYAWMAQLPRMREWVGPRIAHNMAAHSYELANKPFELTLEVDRDKIEDDQLGIFAPHIDMMGQQAGFWADDMRLAALQAGHTSAAVTFDGVPFFSTSHPVDTNDDSKGVQSNVFTLQLNATNYEAVRVAMLGFKGEDERCLNVNPRYLVVPPQLESAAKAIVVAERLANGADNTLRGTAELIVVPQLANEPTAWYLMDLGNPIKPLVVQIRKAPEFVAQTNASDDNVFHHRKFVYGTDARGAAGYGLWFLAARSKP